MKDLIKKVLKEQYDSEDSEIKTLKKELKEVEEDYEDIISKYNFLKKKIEVLEYRNNIPYLIGFFKDKNGNEYMHARIKYEYSDYGEKNWPYDRIYIGPRRELESFDPIDRDKRIRQVIKKYLKKKYPL